MIESLVLEEMFIKHFQKNISIHLNNKIIRTGKLILFAPKEYYLVFCIGSNAKFKHLELPLPFKFQENKNSIYFDYSSELLSDDPTIKLKVDEYFKIYKSKYLNNKLAFHFT